MKTFGVTDYTNLAPYMFWTDGQTDGRTDGRTDRRTDGRTDGRPDARSGPTIRPAFAKAMQVKSGYNHVSKWPLSNSRHGVGVWLSG